MHSIDQYIKKKQKRQIQTISAKSVEAIEK